MRSLFSRLLLANWLYLSILFIIFVTTFFLVDTYRPEFKFLVIFIFGITSLYATFHVSYRIAESISSQLKFIENKTEAINEGDFGIELPNTNIKELTNLSLSINSMSKRLKTQFVNLALEKEKFDSLLENLKEGVFAIDLQKKILFQNPSIPPEIIAPNSQLRNFDDACKNKKLNQFINAQMAVGSEGQLGINIGKRFFSIHFYSLKNENNVNMFIGVVIDKTQERDIQKMREEFVQSASHELKTPITSIKGYAETLEARLNSTANSPEAKFLNAILRNTDRMIRIVDDMLLISQLEDQKVFFQPDPINLYYFLEDLRLIINGFLSLKNQTFDIEVDTDIKLLADPVLLEHLLLNLIKNASAYSPNDSTISVVVSNEGFYTAIRIIDRGIGISAEDSRRVFERFYRVDKNRSRKAGGTGLGLAIVKHITKLHNGKVSVYANPEGRGSVFYVQFPGYNVESLLLPKDDPV